MKFSELICRIFQVTPFIYRLAFLNLSFEFLTRIIDISMKNNYLGFAANVACFFLWMGYLFSSCQEKKGGV